MTREKERLFLMRRSKRIKQIDIAKSIGCGISWISMHENGRATMGRELQIKYKNYIENA